MQQLFDFSPDVLKARQQNKPILALESTLITHGFPAPINYQIARESEAIAREHGVTPATIAILNGKIKIGLTSEELEQLVATEHCVKASKRDIAYAVSQGLSAGTTVAGTLFLAHQAGIKVFATGGIGGVHHGDGMDISADLTELGRTPIAIVCAGAKSILDLPRTLEYLETMSVSVIGYQTDTLPAFYTASTEYGLTTRLDDIKSMADLLHRHWQLNIPSGVLVANPIPKQDEIAGDIIEPVIQKALATANANHIKGKDITPFLLGELVEQTKGASLKANLSLIKNNVSVGAKLAAELHSKGA